MMEIISSFFRGVLMSISGLINPVTVTLAVGLVVCFLIINSKYKKTTYYKITKTPLLFLRADIGKLGEYMTYKKLRSFEDKGARFLFNVYIPKENGEMTEIDVLMISPKGLFVLESKNYSGWIFGSEYQQKWYQTLPQGRGKSRKDSFYNPVMQNRSHINHLKAFLDETLPIWSVIVFSERCTLKKVEMKSEDIKVIKRTFLFDVVSEIFNSAQATLSSEDIEAVYNKLYPLTQVDGSVKQQHIENIRAKEMMDNS